MPADQPANPPRREPRMLPTRRTRLLLALFALILALVILPPYLSVSRFQRRIVTSISQALGRPVHLDHVTLHLLPFPAFTIDNLVIDELPPFGAEPIIRANTVSARLRLSSLWRRRIEFSRITFTEPSINLVRNPDGRWNLESFLLQAAHINAAPTTQPRPSSVPRFPYIEATGARINLKLAQQKTPFSLTEAELALWLPEPQQWKLRLRGRPARTDTGASDTGLLQTEATLERAGSVGQVPLTLDASWTDAPLGEASRVLTGADAGLRGDLLLTAHLAGTLDHAAVQLELKLNGMHRADFVPDRPVDVDLACQATATRILHAVEDLRCAWTLPESTRTELLDPGAVRARFTLVGGVPDLLAPASANLAFAAEHIPAATLLTWARATTGRLAPGLHATGELNGTAMWPGTAAPASAQFQLTQFALAGGRLGLLPITFAPATFTGNFPYPGSLQGATLELKPTAITFGRLPSDHAATGDTVAADPSQTTALPVSTGSEASDSASAVNSAPGSSDSSSTDPAAPLPDPSEPAAAPPVSATASLSLAPGTPASSTTSGLAGNPLPGGAQLSGSLTTSGYTARLYGLVPLPRLLALGADVPAFGAGLAQVLPTNRATGPTRVDLTVHRLWGAVPLWSDSFASSVAAPAPAHTKTIHTRHRR